MPTSPIPENQLETAFEPPTSPSLWAIKPWWCQPWSIVLTGILIPTGSWVGLQRWWITAPIALGIAAWWWLFLYWVPRQYAIAYGRRDESAAEE